MKFKLHSLQYAIFAKSIDVQGINKNSLLLDIDKSVGSIFDGTKQVLPIPDDTPAGIPRIMLASQNGNFSCNISSERIDIFRNNEAEIEGAASSLDTVSNEVLDFFDTKLVQYNRIGVVGKFSIEDFEGTDSIGYINKNFFQDGKFQDPYELEFICNKRKNVADRQLNHRVRVFGVKGKQEMFLEIDINTLTEDRVNVFSNPSTVRDLLQYGQQSIQGLKNSFPNILL